MIQCRDATVSDNFDDFMRICVHQVGLQVDVIVHLAEVLLHKNHFQDPLQLICYFHCTTYKLGIQVALSSGHRCRENPLAHFTSQAMTISTCVFFLNLLCIPFFFSFFFCQKSNRHDALYGRREREKWTEIFLRFS